MEQKGQYLRYKDAFKKQCVFKAATSAIALLTLILLVFIPCFQIKITEEVLGMNVTLFSYNFSVFDEIRADFKMLFSAGKGWDAVRAMSFVQIGALILIIAAVVWAAVDCVKAILNVMNIDDYALNAYNDIKTGADKTRRGGWSVLFGYTYAYAGGAMSMALAGISLEIFYIIFMRSMAGFFEETPFNELSPEGYFLYVNGINGWIAALIIFGIGFITLYVMGRVMKNKLRTQILKEKYEVTENDGQEIFS